VKLFRRAAPDRPLAPLASYELVTRAGCHLCDEMAALLDEVLPEYAQSYGLLDVDAQDTDPALRERFGDVVPVLLRDGQPVAKVRLDRRSLERIVRRRA
jgi:thiol-disulfide isomerase/thioredoxin